MRLIRLKEPHTAFLMPADYQDVDVQVHLAVDAEDAVPLKQLQDLVASKQPQELTDLDDVDTTQTRTYVGGPVGAPTDGDVLHYNGSESKWQPINIWELTDEKVDVFNLLNNEKTGTPAVGQVLTIKEMNGQVPTWTNMDNPVDALKSEVTQNSERATLIENNTQAFKLKNLDYNYQETLKLNTVNGENFVIGTDWNDPANAGKHDQTMPLARVKIDFQCLTSDQVFQVPVIEIHSNKLEVFNSNPTDKPDMAWQCWYADSAAQVQESHTTEDLNSVAIVNGGINLIPSTVRIKKGSPLVGDITVMLDGLFITVSGYVIYIAESGEMRQQSLGILAAHRLKEMDRVVIKPRSIPGESTGQFGSGAFHMSWQGSN